MMKKLLLSINLLVVGAALYAQSALPFLRINRDAATSALGGAQATSALYNPAAVPSGGSDVALSVQFWSPKATHVNLLGGIKAGKRFGLTFLAAHDGGESYPVMDQSGTHQKDFTPSELVGGIGAGFALTDKLSLGATAKYASETLAENVRYGALAFDAFLLYNTGSVLVTGGVSSLGGGIKSGDTVWSLPSSATLGAQYKAVSGKNGVKVAADFDYFFAGGITAALGAQYAYNDKVFARAGYHLGTDKAPLPSYATVGFGVKFSGFHLDLSYLLAAHAPGGTFAIGAGYAF